MKFARRLKNAGSRAPKIQTASMETGFAYLDASSRTYRTPGADSHWRVSSAVRSDRMTKVMGSPKNSLRLQELKC